MDRRKFLKGLGITAASIIARKLPTVNDDGLG